MIRFRYYYLFLVLRTTRYGVPTKSYKDTKLDAICPNLLVNLRKHKIHFIYGKRKNELSLELRPEVATGTYSNLAIITHSHSEFIIDFAGMLPGMPKPNITNRIIMNPEHAKRLLIALQDNVKKYESNFGPIDMGVRQNAPQTEGGTFDLGGFGPFNNGTKS